MLQKLKTKRKEVSAAIKKVISRASSPDSSGSLPQHKDAAALHAPLISQPPSIVNPDSTALTQTQDRSPGPTEHTQIAVQSQSSVDVPAIVIDPPPPQANSLAADVVSSDA